MSTYRSCASILGRNCSLPVEPYRLVCMLHGAGTNVGRVSGCGRRAAKIVTLNAFGRVAWFCR